MLKSHRVEVDVCTNCAGIWFDSGELQIFLKGLLETKEITPASTRLFKPRDVQTVRQLEPERRLCPKCTAVMKTFNYAYDSNVFVDKCPNCEGIWTDSDEARKLASYLKDDPRVSLIAQEMAKRQQNLDDLREMGDLGTRLRRSGFAASYMPRIILPVGDDLNRERFPVVTVSLIVSCIAVFLYEMFGVHDLRNFVNQYGFIADNFFSIGLVSSMFLHADIFHIFGNMLFLWIFGDNVEDRFGYIGYLFFYLAAGIAAAMLFAVFHWGSNIPCIGASGAISGVLGAYVIFYPNARLQMLVICHIIPVPAGIYLTIWFLMQLAYALSSGGQDYGVAWIAHIGGFVFGMAVAYIAKKNQSSKELV